MSWIVQLALAIASGFLGGIGAWYKLREQVIVNDQRIATIEARVAGFSNQEAMLHDIDKKLAVALVKLERLESVAFPSIEHASR